MKMGLGRGKNNLAELLELKLLIYFTLEKNCIKIQIFRDSMLVINWVNKIQICRNINLFPLYDEVCQIMETFDSIISPHVYKEQNVEVDRISKEGLMMNQNHNMGHILNTTINPS